MITQHLVRNHKGTGKIYGKGLRYSPLFGPRDDENKVIGPAVLRYWRVLPFLVYYGDTPKLEPASRYGL